MFESQVRLCDFERQNCGQQRWHFVFPEDFDTRNAVERATCPSHAYFLMLGYKVLQCTAANCALLTAGQCAHTWGSLDHGVESCLTKHFFRSHRLISVLGYLQPLYQEHTSLAVLSELTDCTLLAPCCSPMILFWRDWRFLQALQKKSASHPMSGRELGLPQVGLRLSYLKIHPRCNLTWV